MAITVYLDAREKHGLERLVDELRTEHRLRVVVRTLSVGDIWYVREEVGETIMIEEHKQVLDFLASLRPSEGQSKRLRDQVLRMQKTRVPCLGVVLTGCITGLSVSEQKALATKQMRLQLDPERPVVWVSVADVRQLAHHIARTAEQLEARLGWRRGPPLDDVEKGDVAPEPLARPADAAPDVEELMTTARKSRLDTPAKLYDGFLQLVPGVSREKAAVIKQAAPDFRALRRLLRQEGARGVSKLKHRNRALPEKVGQLLLAALAVDD